MASIEQYREILGVTPNASVQEIVQAYRKKAMQLHPDRNPAPDATQQFILLEEAYKYLRNLKEGKITPKSSNAQKTDFNSWWEKEKENTRKKAQERARMRYEEYINSEEYKLEKAKDDSINILFFAFTFTATIIAPVLAYLSYGQIGLLLSILFALITLPFTITILSQPKMLQESLSNAPNTIKYLFGLKWLNTIKDIPVYLLGFSAFVNGLFIFKYALNTVLPTYIIVLTYLTSILCGYLWANKKKKIINKNILSVYGFFFAPLLLNCLFIINYSISFKPHTEKYRYIPKNSITAGTKYNESNLIQLINNEYSQYHGLRLFANFAKIKRANEVTFYFEHGLFCIRVLKETKTRWEYDDKEMEEYFEHSEKQY